MAQQVGSTSGTAPAARETEVTPGGESGVTEAGWPGGAGEAGQAAGGEAGQSANGQARAGRVRGWLRRTPSAAAVPVVVDAPSMVAAGPDLDLASNDPLVGYLLSAASELSSRRSSVE